MTNKSEGREGWRHGHVDADDDHDDDDEETTPVVRMHLHMKRNQNGNTGQCKQSRSGPVRSVLPVKYKHQLQSYKCKLTNTEQRTHTCMSIQRPPHSADVCVCGVNSICSNFGCERGNI